MSPAPSGQLSSVLGPDDLRALSPEQPDHYYRNGGIMQYVLRSLVKK